MDLLISGSTGFVGTNLRNYLSKDHKVSGLSRGLADHPVLFYSNLDYEVLSKFDAFIHLAGKAHDLKQTSRPEEYFQINTQLTKELFDIFLNSECKTFIFISSVKAVADKPQGILDEKTVPKPNTVYGESKLAAENYILSKSIPADKKVYILRPCMIHGPGNKGNLNLLHKLVLKVPYPLGKFNNSRSFLSIHNFCYIIEQLLEKKIDSGIYNLSDDKPLSTNELVTLMGKTLGKNVRVLKVPPGIVLFMAKIGDLFKLPINSHRLEKLVENYVVSNRKLKLALGIDNLPLGVSEGLERTIKSFIK